MQKNTVSHRKAFHKSAIPASRSFELQELREKYFDPVWHAHSEYQLFAMLEGTGTRFIGDTIRSFKPGELILIGPHVPHLWRSDAIFLNKDNTHLTHGIVLYLRENLLGEEVMAKDEFRPFRKLLKRSINGIEFHGKNKEQCIGLMKQMIGLSGIDAIICLLQIFQLLAGAAKQFPISNKTYQQPYEPGEAGRMHLVYDHIMTNYAKQITLKELADLVHMTPSSFSRYFSMRNNKTVSDCIKEIRIEHACKMLAETEQMVSAIGYECGFNTLSNFNVQFKSAMGCPPLDYRKKILQL